MIHVIRDKKTLGEVERFKDLGERGFRGLMMKVDTTRFKVDIYDTPEAATAATIEINKAKEAAAHLKKAGKAHA